MQNLCVSLFLHVLAFLDIYVWVRYGQRFIWLEQILDLFLVVPLWCGLQ